MTALTVSIKHCIVGSNQDSQARTKCENYTDWKGRSKIYFIYWLHDCLRRKSDGILKKKSTGFLYLNNEPLEIDIKSSIFIITIQIGNTYR